MAKKDTQELLVTGGIIGLLVFGIYKLFIEKKQPAATGSNTGSDSPTPTEWGADPTPANPGIAKGEPVPGTTPSNNTGGAYLPVYDPNAGNVGVISDPLPWQELGDNAPADYNQGLNVFPGLNP